MPAKKQPARKSTAKKSASSKSAARDLLEKVMVAVATKIITGGLAAAWPYIHEAIGHLNKLEVATVGETRAPDREDQLAGILMLLGQLGLKAQKFRDIVKACEISDEELGEQLGQLIHRRLTASERVDVDDLLVAAERYGLMKTIDYKLGHKTGRVRKKTAL